MEKNSKGEIMAKEVTYKEAGLKKEDVYSLVFKEMIKYPDGLAIKDIYKIVNTELAKKSQILSPAGEKSLRALICTNCDRDGFIHPYEKGKNWRLTNKGKRIIEQQGQKEKVINTETGKIEDEIPNTIKGELLETYILGLLKEIHPYYSWFHQGKKDKKNERGLDLIANKIGEGHSEYKTIGVQIKNHKETSAPEDTEWLKFLAGCYVRHIEEAIFITTGKLKPEQRREAGEAKITVIEGLDELNRIAKLYKYKIYDEYGEYDEYTKED
ncbi:MAG: restriction endonuclease [Fibromonadales bacterium]|nr:restriction endonuclease [Fibromonadales bacterium]